MEDKKCEVIVQKWEEFKHNWGTRPDGFSLHLTNADKEIFIKKYLDDISNSTFNAYSRPDGTFYKARVSDETFEKVKTSKNGIRDFGHPPISNETNNLVSNK